MALFFNIPGYTNSFKGHWQSLLEEEQKIPVQRINQNDWDFPDCEDWTYQIEQALSGYDLTQVVLIGHSLGCATIVHWIKKYNKTVKAVVLVAPADVDSPKFKQEIPSSGFSSMPLDKLPCYSVVIASEDDEWLPLEKAKFYAEKWNSLFINEGRAGHINLASGYGKWDRIYEILQTIPD